MDNKELTNKEKLINLYKQSAKTGRLPENGLCKCLLELNIPLDNLKLFRPSVSEDNLNIIEGKSIMFWAADIKMHSRNNIHWYKFTPLRQTILGFLIAMED